MLSISVKGQHPRRTTLSIRELGTTPQRWVTPTALQVPEQLLALKARVEAGTRGARADIRRVEVEAGCLPDADEAQGSDQHLAQALFSLPMWPGRTAGGTAQRSGAGGPRSRASLPAYGPGVSNTSR